MIVRFSKPQSPPPGYRVEWWDSDEHYHWVKGEGQEFSDIFSDRWAARRAAWIHWDRSEVESDR